MTWAKTISVSCTGAGIQLNRQAERDRKGKGISEETPIIRNLAKEFGNITGDPRYAKGRGFTSGMESADVDILGNPVEL